MSVERIILVLSSPTRYELFMLTGPPRCTPADESCQDGNQGSSPTPPPEVFRSLTIVILAISWMTSTRTVLRDVRPRPAKENSRLHPLSPTWLPNSCAARVDSRHRSAISASWARCEFIASVLGTISAGNTPSPPLASGGASLKNSCAACVRPCPGCGRAEPSDIAGAGPLSREVHPRRLFVRRSPLPCMSSSAPADTVYAICFKPTSMRGCG